jgi:hypothetical protein
MTVAYIPPPGAADAPAVPLYTRHMPGAIEAARDLRIQAREHAFAHYVPTPAA